MVCQDSVNFGQLLRDGIPLFVPPPLLGARCRLLISGVVVVGLVIPACLACLGRKSLWPPCSVASSISLWEAGLRARTLPVVTIARVDAWLAHQLAQSPQAHISPEQLRWTLPRVGDARRDCARGPVHVYAASVSLAPRPRERHHARLLVEVGRDALESVAARRDAGRDEARLLWQRDGGGSG